MRKFVSVMLMLMIGVGGYFFYYGLFKGKKDQHSAERKISTQDRWITFNPDGEGFSASFPIHPQLVQKNLPLPGSDDSLNYREYQCVGQEGKVYSVSYTTLPDSLLKWGNHLVLNGALKLIVKEDKGQLSGKEASTFKSFPSLDYEHCTEANMTAGTLVLVGKILYKIEITCPLDHHEDLPEEFGAFLHAFEVA